MMSNPKPGDLCRIWYAKKYRGMMPYHGKLAVVEVVCKAKPRNHGVRLCYGQQGASAGVVAVPAGNLDRLDMHEEHAIHARRGDGGWIASVIPVSKRVRPFSADAVSSAGEWRTVMGIWPTRERAVAYARDAIDTWAMGMETIGERIDYTDRRRVLPWHRVAAARRALQQKGDGDA